MMIIIIKCKVCDSGLCLSGVSVAREDVVEAREEIRDNRFQWSSMEPKPLVEFVFVEAG